MVNNEVYYRYQEKSNDKLTKCVPGGFRCSVKTKTTYKKELFNSYSWMNPKIQASLQGTWAPLFYEHVFCKMLAGENTTKKMLAWTKEGKEKLKDIYDDI